MTGAPHSTQERPGDAGPPATVPGPLPSKAAWALRLTVALVGVYVALDIVAQLLPPHYNPVTQAESDLAVGPFGYVMTINFVVRGILSLSLLAGLLLSTSVGRRSPVGILLVGVWGVGAFVLAASPTDVGTETTVHGMVHLATAGIAFLAVAVGEVLLSIRFRGDARLDGLRTPALFVSVLAVLALLVLFYVLQRPRFFDEVFGLVERVFIGLALLWMLLVALVLLRSGRTGRPAGSGT